MTEKEYVHIAQQERENLYRFAVRYTGDGGAAWDAVQDAMVALWQHLPEVSRQHGKGYLIRVMYRHLVDQHRREERFRQKMPLLAGEEWWRQHENFELRDAMQQALSRLTDQQRAILLMKDLEGYAYKEIAALLGLDEMQVAGILYRARVNLKKLLTKHNI